MCTVYLPGVKVVILLLFVFLLGSCTDGQQKFNGFDSEQWKTDTDGCEGLRAGLKDDFESIREELIGLNEAQVRKVLGKPDKVELSGRQQKFYFYFMEKGGQCNGGIGKEGKKVSVRFNALDRVNEISEAL